MVRLGGGRVHFRKPAGIGRPEQPLSGPSRPLPLAPSLGQAVALQSPHRFPAAKAGISRPVSSAEVQLSAAPSFPSGTPIHKVLNGLTLPSWTHTLGLALFFPQAPGSDADLGRRSGASAGCAVGARWPPLAPRALPEPRRRYPGGASRSGRAARSRGRRGGARRGGSAPGERGARGAGRRGPQRLAGSGVPNPPSRKVGPGAGQSPRVGTARGEDPARRASVETRRAVGEPARRLPSR